MHKDLIFFLIFTTLCFLAIMGNMAVRQQAAKRREALDIDPVTFDDWKGGDPNKELPPDAKPVKLDETELR